MNKFKKKFIAYILMFTMAFFVMPVNVWAAESADSPAAESGYDAGATDESPAEAVGETVTEGTESSTGTDDTVVDDTMVDDTVVDEPVVDDTVVDDTVVDDTMVDDTVVDDTVVDDTMVDDTVVDDTVVDDTVVDEPVVDDTVVDEPVVDDTVVAGNIPPVDNPPTESNTPILDNAPVVNEIKSDNAPTTLTEDDTNAVLNSLKENMLMSMRPTQMQAQADAVKPEPGAIIGWCPCGGNLIYHYQIPGNGGYVYYCSNNCGSNGVMSELPEEPLEDNPTKPVITPGDSCPITGSNHDFENKVSYTFATETDSLEQFDRHMHYICCACDYKGPIEDCEDTDEDGYCDYCNNSMQPKQQETEPVNGTICHAACGGTFVWQDGKATEIKGGDCIENPWDWDVNVHDHQCDACHRDYAENEWKVSKIEREADCFQGEVTVTKCWYADCTIFRPMKTEGNPLDPVYPATWKMVDNRQHEHVCINCNGKADKHTEYEAHVMTDWDKEWKQVAESDYPAKDKLPDNFDSAKQTLWSQGRHCTKCEYTEYRYEARDKAPKEHTLTIYYHYADGEKAGQNVDKPFVKSYKEGEEYSVKSPAAPTGYEREANMDVVTGKMPENDEQWTVKYSLIPYTLTIEYKYQDGRTAAATKVVSFTVEDNYQDMKTDSPVIKGFTSSLESVAPSALKNDTVTVWYTEVTATTYTLTVRYVDEEGQEILAADESKLAENSDYSVTTKGITGYECKGLAEDSAPLNGTMDGNKVVMLVYKKTEERTTLTVTWVDEDGTQLDQKSFSKGDTEPAQTITNPTKAEDENYTYEFEEWVRSEDEDGNVTYRATYTATPKTIEPTDPTNPTNPTEPENPGSDDNGGDDNDGDDDYDEPSTTPIADNPTPTTGKPEETTAIDDGEVPMSELPAEDEEEILDEDVPMSDVPKTGDSLLLWFFAAAVSGLAALATGRKRK